MRWRVSWKGKVLNLNAWRSKWVEWVNTWRVKVVLVGTVVNGGVHESSCPWLCGKITWPIPDSAKITSFTDPSEFLKFKVFFHLSYVHAPLSAQTLGHSSRLRSRCLSGKGWDTPKISAKTSVQKSLIVCVQFGCSVVSDSLQPHGLQHARFPCLSPYPRACSNSCPSNQWCHPTISSSVVPFSSCL